MAARVVLLAAAATAAVPKPSADILRWTRAEVEAMVTFNMATMETNCTGNGFCVTVGGCSGWLPDVDAFNPEKLDTDQWARSLQSFGDKFAILVAQHCSGFSMFPTNAAVLKAAPLEARALALRERPRPEVAGGANPRWRGQGGGRC